MLAIYSQQVGSFESSEVELLSEIANNLAYGITALRSQEEGKRATAALQEAERRYRQLVEQVPAISYVAEPDESGHFHYISPQVEHILGFTPEEWMADDRDLWFERADLPRTLRRRSLPNIAGKGNCTGWNTGRARATAGKSGFAMKQFSFATRIPESY